MTQQHFIAIAAILKSEIEEQADIEGKHAITLTAHRLANYFAEINPNFKRQRFLTACGLGG